MLVGKINEINRYPVKSFSGENLVSCEIEAYGLYGDRFCAFHDETKEGWESFITARDIPEMLAFKANLKDNKIGVLSPDGQTFGWDEDLLKEIQKYSKRKVSMLNYKAPNPENPKLMAVDVASVLIITDRSIQKLEAIWGNKVDARRFRANLVVTLNEDINEVDWIGKRLLVGDAELQIDNSCERCAIITIDPNTLERNAALLKKVYEEMNLAFGVYASVAKTGQVHVGDNVNLID